MSPAAFDLIRVPLDGSPESERSLPLAVALAKHWHVPLELVRVASPPPAFGVAPAFDTRLDAERRDALLASLSATAALLRAANGIPVTSVQLVGEVAPTLAALLEEGPPTLVVMTSHGRGGISRFWLGSVTDTLIRHARQPVLVVPAATSQEPWAPEGPIFRRVLVPLDGTPFARGALDVAVLFAFSSDVELHLVRVLEPLPAPEPFPDIGLALDRDWSMESIAEQQRVAVANLELEIGALDRPAGTIRTHVALSASPAVTILEYAHEHQIDLIVLATHGRGGLARVTLGSVADKVLRGAETPVVVCKPR